MNLKTKKASEFFNTEYVNYASYDNIRKISSVIDGQKNAARKAIWYILKKNLKSEIKVSQLDSKVAEEMEYLHGSMVGVIVNLAQNYPGTNNINLLMPEGNFGTRLVPEASAARYIYTYGSNDLFNLFNKNDENILIEQTFEGHTIEPKFLLPVLPLLLVNGSEGISSGFAQKILPRDPQKIKKYLEYRLKHPNKYKKFNELPYYRGFKGEIKQGEINNQFEIYGVFERKGNTVTITELPIGYNLKSYIKVLDKLEEDKKIISYNDYSEDSFHFVLKFNRKFLDSLSDEKLVELLKLKKKVSENYTVMSEHNTVETYDSVSELMDVYFDVKMKYLQKRKDYLIKTLSQEIRELVSKYVFISKVINNELIISKRPDEDIYNDMDKIDKIIKINDSYDYLMQMPVRSMTQKRMDSLMKQIKDKKSELDFVKSATLEEMWLEDLKIYK